MSCHDDLHSCSCPPKCFCKYDAADLHDIGYRKIVQKVPTTVLIKEAKSEREKELISVVAMLDLGESLAETMIREKMSGEKCDVVGCREILKKRLFRILFPDEETH